MAHEIAMAHHERWDGSGYPRGLAGLEIPESARILAIVDVYDALTHRRVYHEALPEDEAMEIMEQGRGKHFDPFLFGVFLSLLPEIRRIAQQNPDDRAAGYVRSAPGLCRAAIARNHAAASGCACGNRDVRAVVSGR